MKNSKLKNDYEKESEVKKQKKRFFFKFMKIYTFMYFVSQPTDQRTKKCRIEAQRIRPLS